MTDFFYSLSFFRHSCPIAFPSFFFRPSIRDPPDDSPVFSARTNKKKQGGNQ